MTLVCCVLYAAFSRSVTMGLLTQVSSVLEPGIVLGWGPHWPVVLEPFWPRSQPSNL